MAEIAVRHMSGDQGDASTMELVGGPSPSAARTWILREGDWQLVQDILDRVHNMLAAAELPKRRKRG